MSSQGFAFSQQPLSPTSVSQQVRLPGAQPNGRQGRPQFVGLSSFEYKIDDKLAFTQNPIEPRDAEQNYSRFFLTIVATLYKKAKEEILSQLAGPRDSKSNQQNSQQKKKTEFFTLEVGLTLPCEMLVEQIELQVQNLTLFQKHFKLLRVEKDEEMNTQSTLHLKHGVFDTQGQLQAFELNTVGVTQFVKFVFLCDPQGAKTVASPVRILQGDNKLKAKPLSPAEKQIEKVKQEILPMIDDDESLDELDGEVAMISKQMPDRNSSRGSGDFGNRDQVRQVRNEEKEEEKKPSGRPNKDLKIKDFDNFNAIRGSSGIKTDIKGLKGIDDSDDDEETDRRPAAAPGEPKQMQKIDYSCDSWAFAALKATLGKIRVTGFNVNQIPAITNLPHFLNQSLCLKHNGYLSDAQEVQFLVGIVMISTKRYIQAGEILRKIQVSYLEQIQNLQKNSNSTSQRLVSGNQPSISHLQVKMEIKKLYMKSAIIELLVAESMCQQNQVSEKIQALSRASELSLGKLVKPLTFNSQIYLTQDPYSALIPVLPTLTTFLILCMTHRKEIIQLSALKLVEFILEQQGCSLDNFVVKILKAIKQTYPNKESQEKKEQESFNVSVLSSSPSDLTNGSPRSKEVKQKNVFIANKNFNQGAQSGPEPSECLKREESQGGFDKVLKKLYNHVLDTYICVLSSISSHILHQLFYEVILQVLQDSKEKQNEEINEEIFLFSVKIAEKIITICQGDLTFTNETLDMLMTHLKNTSLSDSNIGRAVNTLWGNIRQKVFTNYSQRHLQFLIEWIVHKMNSLSKGKMLQNDKENLRDLDLNEDEMYLLNTLLDIIGLVSVGRKKNDEEANTLIKMKQEYTIELCQVLQPLLFWLDFSIERENRLQLFRNVYQTIKDVKDSLPPRSFELDLVQVIIPTLQRTSDFLKHHSPNLNMLKFLDFVLKDFKEANFQQQELFSSLLENIQQHIPHCQFEQIFSIFDKLFTLCQSTIDEQLLKKVLLSFLDKNTMRNEMHQKTMGKITKLIFDMEEALRRNQRRIQANDTTLQNNNNQGDTDDEDNWEEHRNVFFEIFCDVCFFENQDSEERREVQVERDQPLISARTDLKQKIDVHENYQEKLQYFIESLHENLSEYSVPLFTYLIYHHKFKSKVLGLLQKGETGLRVKCHELLDIVSNFFASYCIQKTLYEFSHTQGDQPGRRPEGIKLQLIDAQRLYISQLTVQCIRKSLEQKHDAYLQFKSVIMLDYLFQTLLPMPTYQNELYKRKLWIQYKSPKNKNDEKEEKEKKDTVLDLETLELNELVLDLDVTDPKYLNLRMNLIFKLWPFVQQALNSAWSNIRSICYGLICSMLKIEIQDYNCVEDNKAATEAQFHRKLRHLVLPLLHSLLSSKESESKAGGLNILGSFCGLSYDFSRVKISQNMDFFKRNSQFVSLAIWQLVFDLQEDWDITIKEASVVLIQLCAPREAVKYFNKQKTEKEQDQAQKLLNKEPLQSQHSSRNNRMGGDLGSSIDEEMMMRSDQHQQQERDLGSNRDDLDLMMRMEEAQRLRVDENIESQRSANAKGLEDFDHQEGEFDFGELGSENFDFFVDAYQDNEIQEIISIFRNDFKPPSNLWIEKSPNNAFNGPDYYAEIFPNAIEQFNQQQAQMQAQQQQQVQQQVAQGRKSSSSSQSMTDAFEDAVLAQKQPIQQPKPLTKESQKKEEQQKSEEDIKKEIERVAQQHLEQFDKSIEEHGESVEGANQAIQAAEGKIFERDFENKKEEEEEEEDDIIAEQKRQQEQQASSNNQAEISPKNEQKKKESPMKIEDAMESNLPIEIDEINFEGVDISQQDFKPNASAPVQNILQEIKQEEQDDFKKPQSLQHTQKIPTFAPPVKEPSQTNTEKEREKDEIIQAMESRINETKQRILEEQKLEQQQREELEDRKNQTQILHQVPFKKRDSTSKTTPEFTSMNSVTRKSKHNSVESKNYQTDRQLNINTVSLGKQTKKQAQSYLQELQKSKLNKDNMNLIKQMNNCFQDQSKQKQKLNKSFENLNQHNAKKQRDDSRTKKQHSTSPRKAKKAPKSAQGRKKAYLVESNNAARQVQNKAVMNVQDLNFFIQTLEKDLNDKQKGQLLKDFSSMPTTPTSILKKVEDQMRAMKQNGQAGFSNTCPNIAQILSSLDEQTNSHANSSLSGQSSGTRVNSKGIRKIQQQNFAQNAAMNNSHLSNNSSSGLSNLIAPQLIPSSGFGMSKTQKIDFQDDQFQHKPVITGIRTQREGSVEKQVPKTGRSSRGHKKFSPLKDSENEQKQKLKKYQTNQPSIQGKRVSSNKNSSQNSRLNKSANYINTGQKHSSGKMLNKTVLQDETNMSKLMHQAHLHAKNVSPKTHLKGLMLQNFMGTPFTVGSTTAGKQKVGPINSVLKEMVSQDSYRKKTPQKGGAAQKLNYSEILSTSPKGQL